MVFFSNTPRFPFIFARRFKLVVLSSLALETEQEPQRPVLPPFQQGKRQAARFAQFFQIRVLPVIRKVLLHIVRKYTQQRVFAIDPQHTHRSGQIDMVDGQSAQFTAIARIKAALTIKRKQIIKSIQDLPVAVGLCIAEGDADKLLHIRLR